MTSGETLYCSFCGKSQHEVRHLIAGPTAFICDECVPLCVAIFDEKDGASDLTKRLSYLIETSRLIDMLRRRLDAVSPRAISPTRP